MLGYLALAAAVVAYAVGIVGQSTAAWRSQRRETVDPGLLVRLATDRTYLWGVGAQLAGFAFAFFARAELPLFLVQAGVTSAVGLAALIGALTIGWRLRKPELGLLTLMAIGLCLLVGSAEASPAVDAGPAAPFMLAVALAVAVLLAFPAWKLAGPVPLGVLAGVGFSVVAVASRSVASGPWQEIPTEPMTWLIPVGALIGQTLFAAALQRGSATAATASMDACSVLLASFVGVLLLGDRIAAGAWWYAATGLLFVVVGVVAMARVSAGVGPGGSERGPERSAQRVG